MRTKTPRDSRLFGWKDFLYKPENKSRLGLVENGWPEHFRKYIPKLPVDQLAGFFCGHNGRPTKDLWTMIDQPVKTPKASKLPKK